MTKEQQEAAIAAMWADPSTAPTCPECGRTIAERQRIGRSLYLLPCGHRVGQIGEDGKMLTITVTARGA